MFENLRRGRQASEKFNDKCSENSRSQIFFRTDIFRKLTLGGLVALTLKFRQEYFDGGPVERLPIGE